jgi:hypothetical protein
MLLALCRQINPGLDMGSGSAVAHGVDFGFFGFGMADTGLRARSEPPVSVAWRRRTGVMLDFDTPRAHGTELGALWELVTPERIREC